MRKRTWTVAAALSLLVFLTATYAAAWLLIPPRSSYGSTWASYLEEEENSIDMLYFGSSLVYCNIVPSVIWEETGVTSYLMAGPEQTIPLTYSYIKEACRTQDPKVIAIEITGMFYPQYCNYTKVNVSYMPWSLNRLEATFHAAEPELRPGLLFPILDYHSRWREVTAENIMTHLDPQVDLFAGYTYLEHISPQGETTLRDYSAGTENYARNLDYLHQIYDYCQEQEIELLLLITPTKGKIPDQALTQLKTDVTALSQAHFVDFNEAMEEIGIDDSTDWYDFLHFNCRGADKFSRYLAGYLSETFALPATEGEDEVLWLERVQNFNSRLSALLSEASAS